MMLNPVIIFGAKGLAKAAYDIYKSNGIEVFAFLDDNEELHNQQIGEASVLGSPDDDGFLKYIGKKCDAFVAIEDPKYRTETIKMLLERRKVMPTNALHKNISIPDNLEIGHGNFVNAGVVLGEGSKLGNHIIINSGCTIDYDCNIGDYVQLGAGTVIGAGATIEANVLIGTGSVILPGVKIGKGAQVGPGSVVISNVKSKEVVYGNPAKVV
ncbi:acetyltransferase [Fulvivirgaceae bacterium LMO-SS25]